MTKKQDSHAVPKGERIRIALLGGFQVQVGQSTIGPRQMGETKPRHELLALLLNRGVPVPKDQLVSRLWDGRPPGSATATFSRCFPLTRGLPHPARRRQHLLSRPSSC